MASPAETGFLVVCGEPGTTLREAIDVVWADMPGPRARVDLARVDDVPRLFEEAVPQPPSTGSSMGDVEMADRADDRDGLRLDVLHVPLGPVLAAWPAGLRLDVALQGDVVQDAQVTVVDTADGSFWEESGGDRERRRAASHLDSLVRLLYVAGWDAASGRAAVLRDETLSGAPKDTLVPRYASFARMVGRSRTLRWMTRRLGVLPADVAERHGVSGPALRHAGDVRDRLDGWLHEAGQALDLIGAQPRPEERPGSGGLLEVMPELLVGAGLAEARLIVASLDPDLAETAVVAADG
ncbi:hypothetical protein [Actinomadura rubrisoli]|uniref:hypothetical protein n=1 Tax=Actinomadura rubrisoli TaxID=2530368 RepID=UPI001FB5CC3B|nr:hypothetical protein [Actinomadura rubrisoli]